MEEKIKVVINKDEYSIIEFYRKLPVRKRKKFLKLMISLRKILLDEKDA